MDAAENDLRSETNVNNQPAYNASIRLKLPTSNATMNPNVIDQGGISTSEEDMNDEETAEEVDKINGVTIIGKDSYDDDEEDVSDDDEEEDDDNNDDNGVIGGISIEQPQKKRKLKDLVSNYEFVPRVRPPPTHTPVQSKPSSVGRDIGGNWTDRESFALLDAWGDRFLKLGRKSLFSEEWQEVADKVLQETNIERTVSQCRGRLDTLKKKYRKEKTKSDSSGEVSKWVFFKKMDMLLSTPSHRPGSLSCGIDSGEYVFTNPKVYLNRANGLDEMRDSPENSESSKDEENGGSGNEQRKRERKDDESESNKSSFRVLADSIQKFSEIYEEIENDRRKQMVDLENMRMDFQKEVEKQMREILERAQAEIVKIREDAENRSE